MEQNIYNTVFEVTHAEGSGSCFYLKSHHLFVTNYHVVRGFHSVAIYDSKRNPYLAHVILVNVALDLALLSVDHDFSYLPDISLASDNSLSIGDRICVAGYPLGLPFTVTDGTVSSPMQLFGGEYFIQIDAAVNPGNSGGPIFNDRGEVVGITVAKRSDADNIGFGIRVENLHKLLESISELDEDIFHVQCHGCDELISTPDEYCPSCGEQLPEGIFDEYHVSPLTEFCECAIEQMGINPVLARAGYEAWCFHKGSSEIRMFVFDKSYLFMVSPINLLPKKEVEKVLDYMLSTDFFPYKMGIDGREIFLMYRIHLTDLTEEFADQIIENMVRLAEKADEMDNILVEQFGCEFSAYSKREE